MINFKKSALALTLLLLLVFLCSVSAFASSVPTPEQVYFERSDGKVILVDYEEAVEYFFQDKKALYNATVTGVREALKNYYDIWIAVDINGDLTVLYYSEAVKDGLDYEGLLDNPGAYIVEPGDANYPVPDLEMYLEGVATIKYRTPRPLEFPDWIEEKYVTWHEPWQTTVIDVLIDGSELPGGYGLDDIDEVRILGEKGNRVENNRWRVVIYDEQVELLPGDVVIKIGSNIYY